jgi:prevent-host-death family protein
MRTVGVRELKEHTSEILKVVIEEGESLELTLRGRPVARIVPIEKTDREKVEREFWEHTGELQRRIAEKWPQGVSAVDAVREGRDRFDPPRV